jgi:hypothetical protein
MPLYRQVCDLRIHDLLVIGIAQLDCLGVGAGLKNDVVFVSQTAVDKRWQIVQSAKRWHRSDLTVGKKRPEFRLRIQRNGLPGDLLYFLEFDPTICRHDDHEVLLARSSHNHLCLVLGFNVLSFGDSLGGKRFGMMQNLVPNVILGQTFNKSFWYIHRAPFIEAHRQFPGAPRRTTMVVLETRLLG